MRQHGIQFVALQPVLARPLERLDPEDPLECPKEPSQFHWASGHPFPFAGAQRSVGTLGLAGAPTEGEILQRGRTIMFGTVEVEMGDRLGPPAGTFETGGGFRRIRRRTRAQQRVRRLLRDEIRASHVLRSVVEIGKFESLSRRVLFWLTGGSNAAEVRLGPKVTLRAEGKPDRAVRTFGLTAPGGEELSFCPALYADLSIRASFKPRDSELLLSLKARALTWLAKYGVDPEVAHRFFAPTIAIAWCLSVPERRALAVLGNADTAATAQIPRKVLSGGEWIRGSGGLNPLRWVREHLGLFGKVEITKA